MTIIFENDNRQLQRFASHAQESRGRLFPEKESESRTAFQRDRDRIIHSTAFRRLKHKTQVFVYHVGDHYRTRLTHSLEVSQIARTLCRSLGLDDDLGEALALAHDLGHTAFGHAGEAALDRKLSDIGAGGFDHNAQTIRIVTKLETRYVEFDGLNLSWETLEGLAKHNGPLILETEPHNSALPWGLSEYNELHDLELSTYPSAEAQVAALSDDMAYNSHDIDDGLRADLFPLEALEELALLRPIISETKDVAQGFEPSRLIHEMTRRLIGTLVNDLVAESKTRLIAFNPATVDDIRKAGRALIGFSAEVEAGLQDLNQFLRTHMYAHYKVERMTRYARQVIFDLFDLYVEEPNLLPPAWSTKMIDRDAIGRARVIGDYIAGMTDRYALKEHGRHFGRQDFGQY
ncbi:MAG: deoxyguanosinetriphosphate triphosphohydrolase [Pseudomonadota bacterium]